MTLYFVFPDWISTEIIPGLPFRWYGMMYLVAFAVTYLLFMYQVRRRKLDVDSDTVLNMFFWAIIGLLIGARIFATLLFDASGRYWARPWLIFWPFDDNMNFVGLQGMNYYGGLVGAVIAVVIYARAKKIDILDWGDMVVAGAPLGYTFGRIGNFINGELFGRVTTASWGVVFPHARRFPAEEEWVQETAREAGMNVAELSGMVNLPRHPTQLYEAFGEGILLWLVIWFIFRKREHARGALIGIYLIGYGVVRFFIDYYRVPLRGDFMVQFSGIENPPYLLLTPWNFIHSQFYSLLMILGGIGLILILNRREERLAAAGEGAGGNRTMSAAERRKLRRKLRK